MNVEDNRTKTNLSTLRTKSIRLCTSDFFGIKSKHYHDLEAAGIKTVTTESSEIQKSIESAVELFGEEQVFLVAKVEEVLFYRTILNMFFQAVSIEFQNCINSVDNKDETKNTELTMIMTDFSSGKTSLFSIVSCLNSGKYCTWNSLTNEKRPDSDNKMLNLFVQRLLTTVSQSKMSVRSFMIEEIDNLGLLYTSLFNDEDFNYNQFESVIDEECKSFYLNTTSESEGEKKFVALVSTDTDEEINKIVDLKIGKLMNIAILSMDYAYGEVTDISEKTSIPSLRTLLRQCLSLENYVQKELFSKSRHINAKYSALEHAISHHTEHEHVHTSECNHEHDNEFKLMEEPANKWLDFLFVVDRESMSTIMGVPVVSITAQTIISDQHTLSIKLNDKTSVVFFSNKSNLHSLIE